MHLTINKLSDGCSVRDLVVRRARCCMPHCRSGQTERCLHSGCQSVEWALFRLCTVLLKG